MRCCAQGLCRLRIPSNSVLQMFLIANPVNSGAVIVKSRMVWAEFRACRGCAIAIDAPGTYVGAGVGDAGGCSFSKFSLGPSSTRFLGVYKTLTSNKWRAEIEALRSWGIVRKWLKDTDP